MVVSLPQLRADLDLTEGQTILVSSGYGLSFSGLLLLGARVGERVGWRRCLLAGQDRSRRPSSGSRHSAAKRPPFLPT